MQIITQSTSMATLQKIANQTYGNLVKAVVDVESKILIIDAEFHADLEHFLLEQGSQQKNLWGVNLHPEAYKTDTFIEYDSMINLRPNQGNISRGIDNPAIRLAIEAIIKPLFNA